MARIFITGSADGLGQLAAKALIDQGHEVVLHARNEQRAGEAITHLPGARDVLTADLSNIEEIKALASKANASGTFDAVIHNAGVYRDSVNKTTHDGLPLLLVVNSLAPYILTCLMHKPERLVYMSSGMHLQGTFDPDISTLDSDKGKIDVSYSDTKLHDLLLSLAVARKWQGIYSNAVNPGWVPTKMGGAGAPDSLESGIATQVWLAGSDDDEVKVSGHYFRGKKQAHYLPQADNVELQDKFLSFCDQLTGVGFNG